MSSSSYSPSSSSTDLCSLLDLFGCDSCLEEMVIEDTTGLFWYSLKRGTSLEATIIILLGEFEVLFAEAAFLVLINEDNGMLKVQSKTGIGKFSS